MVAEILNDIILKRISCISSNFRVVYLWVLENGDYEEAGEPCTANKKIPNEGSDRSTDKPVKRSRKRSKKFNNYSIILILAVYKGAYIRFFNRCKCRI